MTPFMYAFVMTFALTFSLFTPLDARAQSAYSTQNVADAFALYKTRAHLLAVLADWQAGQYDFAAIHVGHAKAEAASVAADLRAKSAAVPLNAALDTLAALAGKAGDPAVFAALHKATLDALDAALQSTVGTVLNDQNFRRRSWTN